MKQEKTDPVSLAKRTARMYGKRERFGYWEKTKKGEHIPLTSFDSKKIKSVVTREENLKSFLGKDKFWNDHTVKTLKISDLKATQPFVRINDVDKLKSKIDDNAPSHVRVVKHRGVYYIDDGHHSIMAAKLRGEKYIEVNYFDMDQYPRRLTGEQLGGKYHGP